MPNNYTLLADSFPFFLIYFYFFRHTVAYDDGELGLHRLWQHDERVRILNDPSEWPVAAQGARARLRAAHERLSLSKQDRESRRGMAAAAAIAAEHAAAARGQSDDLSLVEAQRQRLFQKNKEMLNMVIIPAAGELLEGAGGSGAGASMAVATGPVTPLEGQLAGTYNQGARDILGDDNEDIDAILGSSSKGRGRGRGRGGKRRGGGRGRGGRGGGNIENNKKQRT